MLAEVEQRAKEDADGKNEAHAAELRRLEQRFDREGRATSEASEHQVTIWRAKATAAEERATEALAARALSERWVEWRSQ